MSTTPVGLCASCHHQRIVRSGRGSTFSLCQKHKEDARFSKYPRLPVVQCPGWTPREGRASARA